MVVVITGLTNAGKSTISKYLVEAGYEPVPEYTTRPPREGEKDGVDYHFIDDAKFDEMYEAGEFAETLFVTTVYGLWKYGARKEDLKDGRLLTCGTHNMEELLKSGIPMLSVLLDIDKETAKERMLARGGNADSIEEFERRFAADEESANRIRNRMTLVLDARKPIAVNARAIDNRLSLERFKQLNGLSEEAASFNPDDYESAQPMTDAEKQMYLNTDQGIHPYLRMYNKGMPHGKVNQIAWLLLSGSGCGFCKVCRDEPCNIKDGEKCTMNIADYIRKCVHEEDRENGTV